MADTVKQKSAAKNKWPKGPRVKSGQQLQPPKRPFKSGKGQPGKGANTPPSNEQSSSQQGNKPQRRNRRAQRKNQPSDKNAPPKAGKEGGGSAGVKGNRRKPRRKGHRRGGNNNSQKNPRGEQRDVELRPLIVRFITVIKVDKPVARHLTYAELTEGHTRVEKSHSIYNRVLEVRELWLPRAEGGVGIQGYTNEQLEGFGHYTKDASQSHTQTVRRIAVYMSKSRKLAAACKLRWRLQSSGVHPKTLVALDVYSMDQAYLVFVPHRNRRITPGKASDAKDKSTDSNASEERQ